MKRFTMIVALVVIIAMPMFAERVQPETARKVATTFLNNNGAKASQLTDLTKEAGFSNLYIFNGNPGFVVMAADDCVRPILGYSLTGHFRTENMPTNVSGWLQGYNDEIQYAIDNKASATAETAQLWQDLTEGNVNAAKTTTVVNALLQTTWDQNGIYGYVNGQIQIICELYNNLCPYDYNADERTVTGCVATAMAQIMKYWGYPAQGIGSHSYTPSTRPDFGVQSANFGATTYEWTNMPNALNRYSSETEINAIATLMYHCGVSVDMMYDIGDNGGSGAYSEDIPYALVHYFNYKTTANFKYKSSYSNVNDWINLLKTELNASRPIEYNGSGTGGGHAFVCDGYDSNNNFHFNWGWSGNNDGFYALTNLVPGSGGAGGGSYNFTSNQSAVLGIEPSTNIPTPSNLTYTLSGLQNVTLSWGASNGASSYNVYRNNNLIGNTTSTTYADIAAFGTNDYYIRAVDANGQQSLPSNTVTVTITYQTPIVNDLTATLSGNNISLSWTAPEWCYPETPSATLTYGADSPSGSVGTGSTGNAFYWGNRHPANDLIAYNGKALYRISFYVNDPGDYECFIFKGTNEYNSNLYPNEEIAHFTTTASNTGWMDIDFDEVIDIDSSQDLWIFIYDPVGRAYPATYSTYSEHTNGGYYSTYYPIANVSGYLPATFGNAAWLIKTYVTDGTYTYNLYRNGTAIATNLTTTSYTDQNRNNTASLYTVKTNYYGGVTAASNGIGYALGQASINTLTLNANDKMTVTEGSKLTVSGTLSDVNANNLILENGAQLVNNSANVKATVKKDITAYTPNQNDGWCLIASPMTENLTASNISGLLSNAYDLYTFNQSEQQEWRNYKAQNFTIGNKTGYLYANSGNPTLVFEGTLAANATATLLVYDNTADWKGFNLIGNPYPCNTYVDRSFYVMTGDGSDFTLGSNPIPPCTAILVQAQGTGESVVFSKTASKTEPNIAISIKKANTRDHALIDQARVCFNEKDQLKKYSLSDQNGKLYIPQNDQDYAVAFSGTQTEIPVNFKATKNDTYTINIKTENLELDYLHLIDNMTGADIDLLATPNYTFEAKTSDYASRFKLVFDSNKDDVSTASEVFAYISDGEIVVNNGDEATLQILDMTGRIIVCRDGVYTVSTSEMTPGVYVLRLVNGDNVKTQKIIIE